MLGSSGSISNSSSGSIGLERSRSPVSARHRLLVTGGCGLLGAALVVQLLKHYPNAIIRVMDIVRPEPVPELDSENPWASDRVEFLVADVRDKESVLKATRDITCCFHLVSIISLYGRRRLTHEVNVEGTRNMLDACIENGVPYLIYTSTSVVTFDGQEHHGASEDELTYPTSYMCPYIETKTIAEQLVLSYDGRRLAQPCRTDEPLALSSSEELLRASLPDELLTCAIRPCGQIYGPGDLLSLRYLPALARVRSCHDSVKSEATYVENAAFAHICAFQGLMRAWNAVEQQRSEASIATDSTDADAEQHQQQQQQQHQAGASGKRPPRGRAYFITDDCGPTNMNERTEVMLSACGMPMPKWTVPPLLLLLFAYLCELIGNVVNRFYEWQPPVNYYSAMSVVTHQYHSCERAKKEIGYHPVVGVEEARAKTAAYFSRLTKQGRLEQVR